MQRALAFFITGMMTLCPAVSRGDRAGSHGAAIVVSGASLRADLLKLSVTMLSPMHLVIDEREARLTLPKAIEPDQRFAANPLWPRDKSSPTQPLVFELTPLGASSDEKPLRVALTGPVLREVLVTRKRVAKGSRLDCQDLDLQRRPPVTVAAQALPLPCDIGPGMVVRRTLVPSEVVRSGDVGAPPDVAAHRPVRVRVVVGKVALEKAATALADAYRGDTVRVRLNGSAQSLDARVVAHNLVQVEDSQ